MNERIVCEREVCPSRGLPPSGHGYRMDSDYYQESQQTSSVSREFITKTETLGPVPCRKTLNDSRSGRSSFVTLGVRYVVLLINRP